MDHRSKLVAFALWLVCACAHAGYAQLAPPAGWSAGGGTGGSMAAGGAANDALGGGWRGTSGVLNAGGKAVKMPAAYRFAGNAGRFAGRALFLNPALLAAGGIAWLAYECIGYQNGQWVRTCGGTTPPVSTGFEYANVSENPRIWYATYQTACVMAISYAKTVHIPEYAGSTFTLVYCNDQGVRYDITNPDPGFDVAYTFEKRASSCPQGWYVTPAGCVQNPPPQQVTQQEVEDAMAPKPIPDGLPQELPGVPLPIEIPIINPSPENTPRPMWVPQGNPAPVPNTNPRQYTQPGVRVTPAPTPSSPWQVDIKPEDQVGTSPTGATDPVSEPAPVDPDAAPKDPGLCEQYPDVLACQKLELGKLDATPLANKEVPLSISPDTGFPTGGSCPAPKTQVLMGKTFSFSLQPICDFALGIKPILIGFAWLSAALVFLGVARREN